MGLRFVHRFNILFIMDIGLFCPLSGRADGMRFSDGFRRDLSRTEWAQLGMELL